MSLLYLTADRVGQPSGGGRVTAEELAALKTLGEVKELSQEPLQLLYRQVIQTNPGTQAPPDPWVWDWLAKYSFGNALTLAHVYAGTFTECVKKLRGWGIPVTYTAAAHDVAASRRVHQELGMPFPFPHLNDPNQWTAYLEGYKRASALICPSLHSASVMRAFGCDQPIYLVPHGVDLPPQDGLKSPPRFTVGYLGAYGPDKGLKTLLGAWKRLSYPDATLVLAGGSSTSPYVQELCKTYGGICNVTPDGAGGFDLTGSTGPVPHISLRGWVKEINDFYNAISLYVQPSVTEGFGIEVLEALAHGKPVLCSQGAGAADCIPGTLRFPVGDEATLAQMIDEWKRGTAPALPVSPRELASEYTWDKIRARYVQTWKEILNHGHPA